MLKAMFSRTFLVAEATSSSGTARSAAFHTDESWVAGGTFVLKCFKTNTALVSHTLTAGAAAGLLDTALLHPGVRGSVRGGAGQVLVLCLEHLRPCVYLRIE